MTKLEESLLLAIKEKRKELVKGLLSGQIKLCTHGDGKFLIGQVEPEPILFCTRCLLRII